MSDIEPTEEQKQAAEDWIFNNSPGRISLARLLAEREAKLRDQLDKLVANTVHRDWLEACSERDRAKAIAKQALDERDTLRARVAELERMLSTLSHGYHQAEDDFLADIKVMEADLGVALADFATALADLAEAQKREAQHLAAIRAAKDAMAKAENGCEFVRTRDGEVIHALVRVEAFVALASARQRLAHYDDAKAAEGGEG